MTLAASATVVVPNRSPQQVLEFVLDLELYRHVDDKIMRVFSVEGPDAEGRGSARLLGRMPYTPPAPDVQDFVLERWQRITFRGAPRKPLRAVFDFSGTFECRQVPEGTEVTHAYSFDFTLPFRWLERAHRTRLPIEVRAEMDRLVDALRE